jgi:hypothetical protein
MQGDINLRKGLGEILGLSLHAKQKLHFLFYLSQKETLSNEYNSCMLSFAFLKTNLVAHFRPIFIQCLKCNTFA